MYKSFKIVKIDYNYCNYLRKFDNKVSFNAGLKELRPFIGVLFSIGKSEYFAPLSSPKTKHVFLKNTIDIIKIDNGVLGVVNFNNMIPVNPNNYVEYDLTKKSNNINEMKRINLLKKQLRWLTSNKNDIYFKSYLLYKLYKNNKLPNNVKNRCCNFILLEKKCIEFNKKSSLI